MKTIGTDEAWAGYDMLLDTYFKVKEQKPLSQIEMVAIMANQLVEQEKRLATIETKVVATEEKIGNIVDIFSTQVTDWVEDTKKLIGKIAYKKPMLVDEAYRAVYGELYSKLESRAHIRLDTRVRHAKYKAIQSGVTPTISKLSIIGGDPKLKEICSAILREMAVSNL